MSKAVGVRKRNHVCPAKPCGHRGRVSCYCWNNMLLDRFPITFYVETHFLKWTFARKRLLDTRSFAFNAFRNAQRYWPICDFVRFRCIFLWFAWNQLNIFRLVVCRWPFVVLSKSNIRDDFEWRVTNDHRLLIPIDCPRWLSDVGHFTEMNIRNG